MHRAALGVSIADVTINDAQYVGLPEIRGVVVKDIPSEDSPAKAAGLQPGDIIVSVDGKPVEYVAQLQQQIAFRQPGDQVKVEVARKGGVRKTLTVKLQELPRSATLAEGGDAGRGDEEAESTGAAALGTLGVTVAPVTADDAARLELADEHRGLIVTDVRPGGPSWGELVDADRGGPDIILEMEGKPVRTTGDLRRALEGMKPGDIVSLRVYNTRAKNRRVERIRLGE